MNPSFGILNMLAIALRDEHHDSDDRTGRRAAVISDQMLSGKRLVLIQCTRIHRRIMYAVAPSPLGHVRVLGLLNSRPEIRLSSEATKSEMFMVLDALLEHSNDTSITGGLKLRPDIEVDRFLLTIGNVYEKVQASGYEVVKLADQVINDQRFILSRMNSGESLRQQMLYVVTPDYGDVVRVIATEGPTKNILLVTDSSREEMLVALNLILEHREATAIF